MLTISFNKKSTTNSTIEPISVDVQDINDTQKLISTVTEYLKSKHEKHAFLSQKNFEKYISISKDNNNTPLTSENIASLSEEMGNLVVTIPASNKSPSPRSSAKSVSASSELVDNYFKFLDQHRKSQWHTTKYLSALLTDAGAVEITEDTCFKSLEKGKIYFMRRNEGSCLFAFHVPAETTGRVVATGAHCDIPAFLMKPTTISQRDNYAIMPAEIYGGLLPYSWFNRDLGIAGRVIVTDSKGKLVHKLVDLPSIATIPTIAPHLNNGTGMEKVAPDMSAERLHPVISMYGKDVANQFTRALVGNDKLETFDLRLYDMQGPALFGLNKEFIHAQGQDDGICCFALTKGFIEAHKSEMKDISILCIYDNEEIGSETAYGANSRFFSNLVDKISRGFDVNVKVGESIFFSCDVGHANIHTDKSDQWCSVTHGNGVGIRLNAKQLNVSSAVTTAVVQTVAKKHDVKVQVESRRNNIAGGSTISRFIASDSLMRVCDLGVCLTSMHGVREVSHVNDLKSIHDLSAALYKDAGEVMNSIQKQ